MLSHKRKSERAQQAADRRRREDEAPRLRAEVPNLTRLSLVIVERTAGGVGSGPEHIRRIVVERASALFVVPCSASGCNGGVHDITPLVLRELRRNAARFEGETGCDGCGCVLSHVGSAEY
ncbi:Hypothetical protein A7982_00065 [Minicystis rosea]|nr:Hypothetical protein A7982_00065 [Minicystis rosea]